MKHLAATLLAAAAACGGNPAAPDAPGPPPDAASNWDDVKSHYGRLLDLAGAGASDDSPNSEWLPAFEGGSATAAELSRPHMAMADAAGNIYIADKEGHAIRKVTPGGVITTVAGTGLMDAADDTPGPATQRALANPNGLFVKPDGTFYILDLDHARIRKVDTGGTMTTMFAVVGNIAIGRGLWVDGDSGAETVYFSSGSRIERWTQATGVQVWATGFSNLGNIAMDADGRMLAADRGGSRVYLVTEVSGQVTKIPVAGSGGTGAGVDGAVAVSTPLEGVRAVFPAAAADGGGFFAGTHEGCQLWFIDAAGIAHLFLDGEKDAHAGIGAAFDTPGKKLSELRSVTLDATGNVIIVDDDAGYVSRVERK